MMISGVVLQISEATTYSGWIMAVIAMGFYIKLRMSDPFRQLERSMEMVRQLTHAAEELKVENFRLVQRNEELSTAHNTLHGEYLEIRGKFSQLNVSYGQIAEEFADMKQRLKKLEEERDHYMAQFIIQRERNEGPTR